MSAPTFLTTKGERNRMFPFNISIISRYRDIYKGVYKWDNLPDNVPDGFIEECLFNFGSVSAKNVDGLGICIFGCSPVSLDIYGRPLSWIPTGVHLGMQTLGIMDKSDNPVLTIGESIESRIEIFIDIMRNSLVSLRQNIIALRQPIALDGNVGNSANACIVKNEIEGGEQYIPVIDSNRLGLNVIDLKASDYTHSLIGVYNSMDAEILSIMGVKNAGTEKASGITPEETLSVTQELELLNDYGLRLRTNWCNKINSVLGTNFKVNLSDSYINTVNTIMNDDKVDEEL